MASPPGLSRLPPELPMLVEVLGATRPAKIGTTGGEPGGNDKLDDDELADELDADDDEAAADEAEDELDDDELADELDADDDELDGGGSTKQNASIASSTTPSRSALTPICDSGILYSYTLC